MPDNEMEVLDANIVVLSSAPLAQIAKVPTVLESVDLKKYLKGLVPGQMLQVDATAGSAYPMLSFESMRNQRSVNVSANRIEIHDRSGNPDLDIEALAFIACYLVEQLEVSIRTLGTNFDVMFPAPGGQNAVQAISNALFREPRHYLADSARPIGGSGRFYLEQDDGVRYTVAIEPRFGNVEAADIFITSNANLVTEKAPTVDDLVHLVRNNRELVREATLSLFSVTW